LARRSSLGAIAGGVAVFVTAGVMAPLAAAPVAKPTAQPSSARPYNPVLGQLTATPSASPPAVREVLQRKPVHVAKPAPVSHGVISGLSANGIPQVALNAYRVAAARMDNVDSGCGIDWALLAGIGREESDHGRFAGALLHADGSSTPPIIGPALDGIRWDYIPAPANGMQLDGDPTYAHALGPMQFIPSTWAIYGTDANGDGKADIFNINDAALGAARYLCAAGGNLRTQDGQVRAVLAYNHSDQYLAQVLALADAYRRGIPITGIPLGITRGPLPTITDTGYIPPANPGAPTATQKTKHQPAKHDAKAQPSTSHSASASASGGTTSRPAPSKSGSKPTPTRSGTGSAPKPTPTPTPPAPTPSKTCNLVNHLLGKC
jgi:hypothetical protein